jgi:hypothetical protein
MPVSSGECHQKKYAIESYDSLYNRTLFFVCFRNLLSFNASVRQDICFVA